MSRMGDFYIPKNKTEALNEHTTINLHCRNRKLQKHFPRSRVPFRLAARSVPADPESGKGTGIPRISQDKQRTGTYQKGNVFYQKAQEMLKDWNRFKEEVISGTEHKKLKIGLGARVYSNRLFPKIARYFERHPELEVTFYTEAGLDAYAAIKDGSLDMALDRMPENEIGMEKCVCFAKELIREKQCILMAPDHPLAQKKNASIMDCREYTMLTGLEHSVEDRLLRRTYGEQNITWKRVIRSDSIDTVMKMVKSGSGIAIGPKSFAEYYGVTAVPLVPARQDSLYFACLKSKKKEPEIREFQRYLTTLVSSVCPD